MQDSLGTHSKDSDKVLHKSRIPEDQAVHLSSDNSLSASTNGYTLHPYLQCKNASCLVGIVHSAAEWWIMYSTSTALLP